MSPPLELPLLPVSKYVLALHIFGLGNVHCIVVSSLLTNLRCTVTQIMMMHDESDVPRVRTQAEANFNFFFTYQ